MPPFPTKSLINKQRETGPMSDLATYLSKWLCHDLATPAATVMTASELLGTVADAEITGLVQDGAKRLVTRLRLVRAAFGPGGGPLSAKALERLVREGLGDTPLHWARAGDASGDEVALVSSAALLLADLARGSAVTVTAENVHWDGARALPETVVAALAGATPTDSRAAVGAMVAHAAARVGVTAVVTANGIAWR
jgi:hypothetical protein